MSDNIVLIDLKPYTKQMFVQVPCLRNPSVSKQKLLSKATKCSPTLKVQAQSGTFWYGNVLEGFAKIKVRSLE